MPRKTALDLLRMKADNLESKTAHEAEKIAMVTAYDYTMARLVDQAGVDMVLVGDSLGMVIQGQQDTLSVTLEDMAYHGRCVARGLQQAHLTVDLPFMSYQVSAEQALTSAGYLVQKGGAQSVKLEGGERSAPAIARIVEAGIPCVAHVGLTPQSVHTLGGWRVQGRGDAGLSQLRKDCLAVQDAGAFSIVFEMVPGEVAAELTELLDIPTIGIGAGPYCDGQVLVCNDLLGFDTRFKPRFVKRFAELERPIVDGVTRYVAEVKAGSFPAREHGFWKRKARPEPQLAKLY
jgi:3-methyl-2-oxobutanoate hydroxymethyltransferase